MKTMFYTVSTIVSLNKIYSIDTHHYKIGWVSKRKDLYKQQQNKYKLCESRDFVHLGMLKA